MLGLHIVTVVKFLLCKWFSTPCASVPMLFSLIWRAKILVLYNFFFCVVNMVSKSHFIFEKIPRYFILLTCLRVLLFAYISITFLPILLL